MKKLLILLISLLSLHAFAGTINVVAAENFYGELAHEIGGKYVHVDSIISNPDADPHLFSTSPATSKAMVNANIVIYNGVAYDPWIKPMIADLNLHKVTIIKVSDLVGVKDGANPHIWYKPDTFPTLAKLLTAKFSKMRPKQKKYFNKNLNLFLKQHDAFMHKVNQAKNKFKGTPVIATEPVFGYMADSLGLKMKGLDVQWKIMNNTTPSASMFAKYQDLIKHKKVKVLFYNNQVKDKTTQNIKDLAQQKHIPIVGVTETMPLHTTIMQWLNTEFNQTVAALNKVKK